MPRLDGGWPANIAAELGVTFRHRGALEDAHAVGAGGADCPGAAVCAPITARFAFAGLCGVGSGLPAAAPLYV